MVKQEKKTSKERAVRVKTESNTSKIVKKIALTPAEVFNKRKDKNKNMKNPPSHHRKSPEPPEISDKIPRATKNQAKEKKIERRIGTYLNLAKFHPARIDGLETSTR